MAPNFNFKWIGNNQVNQPSFSERKIHNNFEKRDSINLNGYTIRYNASSSMEKIIASGCILNH